MTDCSWCHIPFAPTVDDLAFYARVSPRVGNERFPLPPPRLCPSCRRQRRFLFRNDMDLYLRTSSRSGQRMVSVHHDAVPFPVYTHSEFWDDSWDPLAYGREFDFSKPFFEQFAALSALVPRANLYQTNCDNCGYSNQIADCKNCYYVFSGVENEDCYFSYRINYCRDCCDCLVAWRSELCYECVDVYESYGCRYSTSIANCTDSAFLFDCRSCQNCLFCFGLKNQSYCIYNQKVTKEEFERQLASLRLDTATGVAAARSTFSNFISRFPRRAAQLISVEHVTGDNTQQAKDSHWVFDCQEVEDAAYCQFVAKSKNIHDANWCFGAENHYEISTGGLGCNEVLFCVDCWPTVNNLLYSMNCSNGVRDSFGCIGLRQKQYCILNRQHTKAEYEALLPRILQHLKSTGEWGDFFPPQISAFGYNETVAQDYFPLDRAHALARGFHWNDNEPPPPTAKRVIAATSLPDSIHDAPDSILEAAIESQHSAKLFRLIAQELRFYRAQQIPLPRHHPLDRHRERITLRTPRHLWSRQCTKCRTEVETTYSPASQIEVLCDPCYHQLWG